MKAYSGFQTHSAPSVNLSYSQLCHILSAGIFKTVGVFKTLRNVGQAYSELCHRALLSNNHIYSGPCICRNLAYSESWNIQNFSIFASRRILEPCHIYENVRIFKTLACLKLDKYLEPSQRFKMEFFLQKIIIITFATYSFSYFWLGSEEDSH